MSHHRWRLFLVCLLLGDLALALPAGADQQLPCTTSDVSTQSGPVCGLSIQKGRQTIHSYLGIPFAQPPIVTDSTQCETEKPSSACLRWKPPQPPQPWTSHRQATEFGPECPQPDQNGNLAGDENCLYLNVWAPKDASQRPVMVWIHGGAYFEGTGSTPLFDGLELAATGNVVVVDFNYRLGALGFLVADDKVAKNSLTGNYGFLDQQAVLKWVHDNIANFGGDPAKVTIFGQSAGAMSVGLHLVAAPGSQGWFRAGIMESNPLGIPFQEPATAQEVGKGFLQGLSCTDKAGNGDVGCLYAKDLQDIFDQQQNTTAPSGGSLTWGPVIDGTTVDKQPIASFGSLRQPVVLGTNHDEGTFFVYLEDPYYPLPSKPSWGGTCAKHKQNYKCIVEGMFGTTIGDKVLKQYPAKTGLVPDNRPVLSQVLTDYLFTCANRYVAGQVPAALKAHAYQFNASSGFQWPLPACATPVCHSAELPYVFATPEAIDACDGTCSFNQGQSQLSTAMMGYWTSFASSLEPGGSVAWPAFDQYLLFDATSSDAQITASADPFKATCCFWEKLGLYGPPSQGCADKGKG